MTARPITSSLVPAGATVVGQRSPAQLAAAARSIVAKAVNQRNTIIAQGAGYYHGPEVRAAIGRLQTWLDRSPFPSRSTLLEFLHGPLFRDLRLVMPSTAGGATLLNQFEHLLDR